MLGGQDDLTERDRRDRRRRRRRLKRKVRRNLPWVAVLLAIVGLLAFTGYRWSEEQTTHLAPLPTPASEPPIGGDPDKQTVVVVIGDSYTGGSDMNSGPTWPNLLATQHHWMLFNQGVGGSGYLAPGIDQPFSARIDQLGQYAADLVILAGGLNDVHAYPLAQITAEAERDIKAAEAAAPSADVMVFSPFSNGPPTPELLALRDGLRAAAQRAGVPYLDVTGFLTAPDAGLIGSDGVHPTDEGHHELAARIGAALAQMGLPRPDAYQPAS